MGHSTSSGRTPSGRLSNEEVAANRALEGVDLFDRDAVRGEIQNNQELRRMTARTIDRAPIEKLGNVECHMDFDGVGGGQILDETGGSRDPAYGRGGKVYSVRAWDADYNEISSTTIGGSLNDAKRELREMLHRHYGTRG